MIYIMCAKFVYNNDNYGTFFLDSTSYCLLMFYSCQKMKQNVYSIVVYGYAMSGYTKIYFCFFFSFII